MNFCLWVVPQTVDIYVNIVVNYSKFSTVSCSQLDMIEMEYRPGKEINKCWESVPKPIHLTCFQDFGIIAT